MSTPPIEEFTDFENPKAATVDRLIQALDKAYHRPGLLMWRSFLGGLMYAFGATIGFALVITIGAYVLQALGGVSLFKPFIDKLDDIIVTHTVTAQQQAINQVIQQQSATPKP